MHIDCWTGTETRALREALRLSVRAFAEHLGVAARTVAKWEAGGRGIRLRPDTQAILDTALSRANDDARSRFALMLVARRDAETAEPGQGDGLPGRFNAEDCFSGRPTHFAEIADMDRREVLRLISLAGGLLATPPADGRPDWARIVGVFESNRPLDAGIIDDYAALNSHLWRVFTLSTSKRDVLPMVRSQLDVLTGELDRPSSPALRRQLCVLTADLFQLAGEVFFDGNRYIEAGQCYSLASTAGREADAFDLWACAMTRSGSSAKRCRCSSSQLDLPAGVTPSCLRGTGSVQCRHRRMPASDRRTPAFERSIRQVGFSLCAVRSTPADGYGSTAHGCLRNVVGAMSSWDSLTGPRHR